MNLPCFDSAMTMEIRTFRSIIGYQLVSYFITSLFESSLITLKRTWNNFLNKIQNSTVVKEDICAVKKETALNEDTENEIEKPMNQDKACSCKVRPCEVQLFFPLFVDKGELKCWNQNDSTESILQPPRVNELCVNKQFLHDDKNAKSKEKGELNTKELNSFFNLTNSSSSVSKNSQNGLELEFFENHLKTIAELRKKFLQRRTKNYQMYSYGSLLTKLDTQMSDIEIKINHENSDVTSICTENDFDSNSCKKEDQDGSLEVKRKNRDIKSGKENFEALPLTKHDILTERNIGHNQYDKDSYQNIELKEYLKEVDESVATEILNYFDKLTIGKTNATEIDYSFYEACKTSNDLELDTQKYGASKMESSDSLVSMDEFETLDTHKNISSRKNEKNTEYLRSLISEINRTIDDRYFLRIQNKKLILVENSEGRTSFDIATVQNYPVFKNDFDTFSVDENSQNKISCENLIVLDEEKDKSNPFLLEKTSQATKALGNECSECIIDGIEIYKRLSESNENKNQSFELTPKYCNRYGVDERNSSTDSIENETTSDENSDGIIFFQGESSRTNSIKTSTPNRTFREIDLTADESIEDPLVIKNIGFRSSISCFSQKELMTKRDKLNEVNRGTVPSLSFQSWKASPENFRSESRISLSIPDFQCQKNISTSSVNLKTTSEILTQTLPYLNEHFEMKEDSDFIHTEYANHSNDGEYLDPSSYEDDSDTAFPSSADDAQLIGSPNSKFSTTSASFTELKKNTESCVRRWYMKRKKSSFKLSVKKMCSKLKL